MLYYSFVLNWLRSSYTDKEEVMFCYGWRVESVAFCSASWIGGVVSGVLQAALSSWLGNGAGGGCGRHLGERHVASARCGSFTAARWSSMWSMVAVRSFLVVSSSRNIKEDKFMVKASNLIFYLSMVLVNWTTFLASFGRPRKLRFFWQGKDGKLVYLYFVDLDATQTMIKFKQ